ncbi:PucR family transcriptional regulator, partial [Patulibacter sp. S7RM1-6]
QGRAVLAASADAWVASVGPAEDPYGALVLHRPAALSQPQRRTLERAAMLAALVLAASERVAAAAHRDLEHLVGDLLRRPDVETARLHEAARGHGVPVDRPCAVVVLRGRGVRPTDVADVAREALDGVPALVAVHDGDVVLLVGAADAGRAATRAHRAVARAMPAVSAVVSRPVPGSERLPAAHRRAVRCARLLEALDRAGTLSDEGRLLPYATLLGEQDADALRAFVEEALGPLLRHDEARGSALAHTLLVFVDQGLRTAPAADALHLHPNTLRQRLEKIGRLLPGWDEPHRRLEIHLALRVRELQQALD